MRVYLVFFALCFLLLAVTAYPHDPHRNKKGEPENDILNVGADFTALCPNPEEQRDKNGDCYGPDETPF